MLTGNGRRPFETTFRLVSYVNGSAAPLLLVPMVGDFLFLLVGAYIEIQALRHGHELSLQSAIWVEILPVSMLILTLVAVTVVSIFWWSQVAG